MGCCRKSCGWLYLSIIISFFTCVLVLAPYNKSSRSTFRSEETVLFDPNPTWWQSVEVSLRKVNYTEPAMFNSSSTGFFKVVGSTTDANHTQPAVGNFSFTLHRFKQKPPKLDVPLSVATTEAIPTQSFAYANSVMYLNAGSKLNVSWTSGSGQSLAFWVFAGKKNFNAWEKQRPNDGSGSWPQIKSAQQGTAGTKQVKASSSDVYYFVWGCQSGSCLRNATVSATGKGTMRQFNLTNTKSHKNCTSNTTCTLSMKRTSEQIIILTMNPADSGTPVVAKFKTTIRGRHDFYWPLFICGGWGVFSMISLIILCCKACCTSRNYEEFD